MKSIEKGQRTMQSAAQTSMLCCLLVVVLLAVVLPRESHGFPIRPSTTTATTQRTTRTTAPSRPNTQLDATMLDLWDVLASTTIVAPSADALAHLHGAATATAIPIKAAAASASSSADLLPTAGDLVKAQAQQALEGGWKVLDAATFVHGGADSLPGFSETQSIVAPHLLPGPSDESVTLQDWPQNMFKARMEYASTMLKAIQKLPYVAFGYALVEFFLLRNDVDIYKEDVEEDPSGVLAETVSDASVRFAIFFGLAVVTYVIS